MTMKRASASLLVLGLLAMTSTASAWKVASTTGAVCDGKSGLTRDLPHKWRTLPVQYYIYSASTTDMNAADQQAQLASGFTAWDAPTLDCSATGSMFAGDVGTASLGNGKNEVVWLKTGIVKPWPYDHAILGLTTTISDREKGTSDDQPGCPDDDRCAGPNQYCPAVESDIELNNDDMQWTLDSVGNPRFALIHTILAHEIGHFYGLGHDNETRADGPSLMNYMPTAPNPREDDKTGICTIYPKGSPLCASDSDCILGDICKAYTVGAGLTEVNCPKTQACVEGSCKDLPAGQKGTPCLSNEPNSCMSGLECKTPEGTWRGHCTGPCTTNEECGGSGRCVVGNDGMGSCVFGGTIPGGESCLNSADCASGVCNDEGGICAFNCAVDCDCADGVISQGEGLACVNGACVTGRSTCYFPTGEDGDRKFTGTLCAASRGHQEHGALWLVLSALGLVVSARRRRR